MNTGYQPVLTTYSGCQSGQRHTQLVQITEDMEDDLALAALKCYHTYVLQAIQPYACRAQLAVTVQRCAIAVLGSAGGFGHQWGTKLAPDGRTARHMPEYGPYYIGHEGATMLRRLKMEYAASYSAALLICKFSLQIKTFVIFAL